MFQIRERDDEFGKDEPVTFAAIHNGEGKYTTQANEFDTANDALAFVEHYKRNYLEATAIALGRDPDEMIRHATAEWQIVEVLTTPVRELDRTDRTKPRTKK